jgi:hypothetical protein
MEQWIQFAQDKWYIILAALVVVWIALAVVKTVIKWIIVLVIIAGLIFYGSQYQEELQAWGSQVANITSEEAFLDLKAKISGFSTQEAVELALGEPSEASFEMHEDQTFTVTTGHIQIDGSVEGGELSSEAVIRFKNQESGITININDYLALKQFVAEVQVQNK